MSEPLLVLDGVTLHRGARTLFEHLSMTLGPGQAAVVAGPNGVGKSSLLRLCAGLLPPTRGKVEATGSCAFLDEASALDADRTLAAALEFWAGLDGTRARLSDAMEAVALTPLAEVPVKLLSTGQRRRAGLARVVASGAALWLLDEPINGLDAPSVALVEGLIDRHRNMGGAVLVASHFPLALPGAAILQLGQVG